MFDNDASKQIESYLAPGERLLWAVRAATGIRVTSEDSKRALLSVLLLAGFGSFLALTSTDGMLVSILLWIPPLVVGIVLGFYHYRQDARQRGKTTYGLTDQRVLILSGTEPPSIKTVDLATLQEFWLVTERDGSGEVILGRNQAWEERHAPRWLGYKPTPRLVLASGAQEVFEMISKAQGGL